MFETLSLIYLFQTPSVIPMVYHLAGHSAVDADVLAGDETGLFGAEIQHHVGDVQGIAHTARRLLHGIGTFIDGVLSVNPAWGDGVDAHLSCQADRQRAVLCFPMCGIPYRDFP